MEQKIKIVTLPLQNIEIEKRVRKQVREIKRI